MIVGLRRLFLFALLATAPLNVRATTPREALVGSPTPSRDSTPQSSEKRMVVRIVDGDTIVVSPNKKVRLIGVDTPETIHPNKAVECFGKDAKEFTRRAVEGKNRSLGGGPRKRGDSPQGWIRAHIGLRLPRRRHHAKP
jgi:endonuclease YncB( thermonuclease family)